MPAHTCSRVRAVALGLALAGTLGACNKSKRPRPAEQAAAEQVAPPSLVVGFAYQGPKSDGGFNQAHAAGAAAVAALPGVKVVEQENVPETGLATAGIEKLIVVDGASLVFATAFGHFDPPVLKLAAKYPRATLLHSGGLYQEGKHPANVGTFHGYLDEAFYVSGIVAGMTSSTRKLGFIAGKGHPHVLRNINAFTLGARSVDPGIRTTVVFTGQWSDAAAEARAANDLIDKKVDVLAMYVNAPAVILETAERRGIYSIGVHVDGARFAPKGQLTAAVSNWERIYVDYVSSVRDGKPFPPVVRGGMASGFVNIAAFGPAVSAQAKKRALEARDLLASGRLTIFKGPLKNNDGGMVLPPGRQVIQKDIQLEQMAYLVEGVLGKLPE